MSKPNLYLVTVREIISLVENDVELLAWTAEDAITQARLKFQGWSPKWDVIRVEPLVRQECR